MFRQRSKYYWAMFDRLLNVIISNTYKLHLCLVKQWNDERHLRDGTDHAPLKNMEKLEWQARREAILASYRLMPSHNISSHTRALIPDSTLLRRRRSRWSSSLTGTGARLRRCLDRPLAARARPLPVRYSK